MMATATLKIDTSGLQQRIADEINEGQHQFSRAFQAFMMVIAEDYGLSIAGLQALEPRATFTATQEGLEAVFTAVIECGDTFEFEYRHQIISERVN